MSIWAINKCLTSRLVRSTNLAGRGPVTDGRSPTQASWTELEKEKELAAHQLWHIRRTVRILTSPHKLCCQSNLVTHCERRQHACRRRRRWDHVQRHRRLQLWCRALSKLAADTRERKRQMKMKMTLYCDSRRVICVSTCSQEGDALKNVWLSGFVIVPTLQSVLIHTQLLVSIKCYRLTYCSAPLWSYKTIVTRC